MTAKIQGMLQIVRFNWPQYLKGAVIVVIACAFPLPRSILITGAALAGFWMAASLIVSHIVYDRSHLGEWTWITSALGVAPARWINIHAGLDESTPTLRRMWPDSRGRVLDIFSADEMTEPSISRARRLAKNVATAEQVDYRNLPLVDGACDAAMLLLSAHELRHYESRAALFRELHRVLTSNGKVVLAEHLRDAANFIAFGPGFLHFHSRAAWLRAFSAGGFVVEKHFHITPFVGVFILRRSL